MSEHIKVAFAMAVYQSKGAVFAIAELNKAGFTFAEAVELLVAYDEGL